MVEGREWGLNLHLLKLGLNLHLLKLGLKFKKFKKGALVAILENVVSRQAF
jgi:hypothetical protein